MEAFVTLGISLALGLLIGLQRERTEARLGGIRTFPLISVFGTVCAMLAADFGWGVLVVGFLTAFGVLAVSNFLHVHSEAPAPEPGQTTEVAALLTFALGAYLVNGQRSVAFVAAGVMVVLLHLKEPMHRFVATMGERDMRAVMQFTVITLIILPVLPDRSYGPYNVLNPYDIWRMVVLIVSISLFGYVIYKICGATAGNVLGGILGGLISSTATTVSYSRRSKEAPQPHNSVLFVILVASTVAYGRVLIEIAAVAPGKLPLLAFPLATMLGWMVLLSFALYWIYRGQTNGNMPEPSNPAELKGAFVFGAIYALMIFAIGAAREQFPPSALYGIAVASGLTDMDAITLSTARLVEQQRLDPTHGWRLILTASLANLVFKAGVAFLLGGARLGVRLLLIFAVAIAGGLAIMLFWPGSLS
ncbi:MAG: MgtC/SapB family protein [Verrucomicrobia subdivision 3 bacterium]|nr:MgtC/SapB family protein [Limisphaerales bacterium]